MTDLGRSDPSRAVLYFVKHHDYDKLSGVILAVTGVEALFANLGVRTRYVVHRPSSANW